MDSALEVLNHPVRVTKRAPQGFRLEVIVTRGELVGRWWRRMRMAQVHDMFIFDFLHTIIAMSNGKRHLIAIS